MVPTPVPKLVAGMHLGISEDYSLHMEFIIGPLGPGYSYETRECCTNIWQRGPYRAENAGKI
jgi:hypothetical protein